MSEGVWGKFKVGSKVSYEVGHELFVGVVVGFTLYKTPLVEFGEDFKSALLHSGNSHRLFDERGNELNFTPKGNRYWYVDKEAKLLGEV